MCSRKTQTETDFTCLSGKGQTAIDAGRGRRFNVCAPFKTAVAYRGGMRLHFNGADTHRWNVCTLQHKQGGVCVQSLTGRNVCTLQHKQGRMCVHFNGADTHRVECVYTSTQTGWNVCTLQHSSHLQGGMLRVHFNIAVTHTVECVYTSTQ